MEKIEFLYFQSRRSHMIWDGSFYYDLTQKEKRDIPPQGYPIFVLSCGFSTLITQKFSNTFHPIRKDYQIIYVNKGALHQIDRDNKENIIPEGHFLIFHPGDYQNYTMYLDENPEIYWCHFSGDAAEKLLKKYNLSNKKVFKPLPDKRYSVIFNLMRNALKKKSTHFIELCALYFQELIVVISEGMIAKGSVPTYPAAYTEIINYIDTHYFEKITLHDLSVVGCTNYKTLTGYFLKFQNTTPMKYLAGIRLERSAELLVQTTLQIKAIANAVGYNDPLHFTKSFSKKYGISPKEYRKNSNILFQGKNH